MHAEAQRQGPIGVISDTHGLLRPQVLAAFRRAELIVHAGDIGAPHVLDALRALAPVRAVRGNVDRGPWAEALPWFDVFDHGAQRLYVRHDVEALDVDAAAAGIHVVISGHTHQPGARVHDGVLWLNPGSAGPTRGALPATVALLHLTEQGPRAHFIEVA